VDILVEVTIMQDLWVDLLVAVITTIIITIRLMDTMGMLATRLAFQEWWLPLPCQRLPLLFRLCPIPATVSLDLLRLLETATEHPKPILQLPWQL